MRWVSALSLKTNAEEAVRECASAIRDQTDAAPDLAFLFVSPHFAREYADIPKPLQRLLRPKHLLGCSAGGVIAGGKEAEDRAALGLMAGYLPGATLTPFHVEANGLPDMDAPPKAWAELVGVTDRSLKPSFVLLGDPFSFNPESLTVGLDYAFPGSVKIGGLASGAARPGGNVLYLDGEAHRSGAAGIALTGNVTIDPIVAQGCRPVGKPLKITACEDNQLLELDDKTALEAVEALLETLPEKDQELARTSLFLGVRATPLGGEEACDYLIRNIIGLDPHRGTLSIGAMLRLGQFVQFHLRDKRTSAEDLRQRLEQYAGSKPLTQPRGALLFSCLGRGEHLYGVANHDTDAFLKSVGQLPISGFFSNGEIGPVGGATYLHGYTSCFGILRPVTA
ncbi:MAG: FIST C-terminal domain-containing protein [Elusimicrobia bacterium]|nr:FIST C-terminal domain-containing protein [Elusimicrobiota bacterium]